MALANVCKFPQFLAAQSNFVKISDKQKARHMSNLNTRTYHSVKITKNVSFCYYANSPSTKSVDLLLAGVR